MRKTYKSSNVRFCMEDENQRRTWEYLQSLTRKESSYGKALSDAFVLVLDQRAGRISGGEPVQEVAAAPMEKSIEKQLEEMQDHLVERIESCLERYAFRPVSDEGSLGETNETEQVSEIAMSDAMMSMALAMGE
jgi:hypothetical protein